MKKRSLISITILILTACILIGIAGVAGVVYFMRQNPLGELTAPRETATLPNMSLHNQPTDEVVPDTDIPQADSTPEALRDSLDPGIVSQMETIQAQVIHMRGLAPNGQFSREIQSPEQLRQDLIEAFDEQMSEYDNWEYTLTLSILGLLDEEFDIYHFHVDLLTEQIAGYYDHETNEMVLVAGGEFGGPERMTYAHEYIHALQDQNFDIENGLGYNDEACEVDSERCAALEALLEGDATLSETQWFMHYATEEDHADLMAFYSEMEMPVMSEAPAFLGQDLLFPYQYGHEFVQMLFDRGGWEAVNQAYQSPPVSTEQILHPERYPADIPKTVILPDLLPQLDQGWEQLEQDVIGEWYTYLILAFGLDEEARITKSRAAQAANGWEGDAYTVYYHEQDQSAIMLHKALWESPTEAEEFTNTFTTYANRRFGNPIEQNDQTFWQDENGVHTFYLEDSSTIWIFAPDPSSAISIWQALH